MDLSTLLEDEWLCAEIVRESGQEIAQIGTSSANTDETIGVIIAEAMEQVGKKGEITDSFPVELPKSCWLAERQ